MSVSVSRYDNFYLVGSKLGLGSSNCFKVNNINIPLLKKTSIKALNCGIEQYKFQFFSTGPLTAIKTTRSLWQISRVHTKLNLNLWDFNILFNHSFPRRQLWNPSGFKPFLDGMCRVDESNEYI